MKTRCSWTLLSRNHLFTFCSLLYTLYRLTESVDQGDTLWAQHKVTKDRKSTRDTPNCALLANYEQAHSFIISPQDLPNTFTTKPKELERMFTPHTVSHVMCHVSFVQFFLYKMGDLVCGRSVIHGATPSSFQLTKPSSVVLAFAFK